MKKIISFSFLAMLPLSVLAAQPGTVEFIFERIVGFMNMIVPALITLAVIYFIWGVIQFISSSDEEAKKGGRAKIINGLIGLFVIVSFWGIIAIVKNTFQVGSDVNTNLVPRTGTTQYSN